MLNTMMATTDVNERDLASIELPGVVRRLWPAESAMFRDHLLRLDAVSRRMRFAHGVSDSFICGYADHMSETGALTYAYVEDGEVRAAAELNIPFACLRVIADPATRALPAAARADVPPVARTQLSA